MAYPVQSALLAVGLLLAAVATAAASAPPVQHSWVFQCSVDKNIGYTHMSTIEQLRDGTLVVAFQAAKVHEGDDDQSIFFKASSDGGRSWTPHTVVASAEGHAVWGPVLHWDNSTGLLWLFYSQSGPWNTRGVGANWPGGEIRYITSDDGGQRWSNPTTILPFYSKLRGNISKVTANKPIVTSRGWWLLPFWQEAHTKNDTGFQGSGVLITKDSGATWVPYGFLHSDSTWLIENTLAETDDGILQLFRTTVGYIYSSMSTDGGLTWSTPGPTTELNPNSKVFVMSTPSPGYREQILSYNPSKTVRDPLTVALSTDGEGKVWRDYVTLDDTDMCPECHEFEYPTSLLTADGTLYTTYSADTHVGIRLATTTLAQT